MKILIAATLLSDDQPIPVADDGTVLLSDIPLTRTVLFSPQYSGLSTYATAELGAEDLGKELRNKLIKAADAMQPGDKCVQVGLGKLPTVRCMQAGLTPPEAENRKRAEKAEMGRDEELAVRRLVADQRKAEMFPEVVATLEWYREQVRRCRLIHSEGDKGRNALADDGGKRASDVLAKACREIHGDPKPDEALSPSKADCEDLIRAGHTPGRVFIPEGFTQDTLVRTLVVAREKFVERTQRCPEMIVLCGPHFREMRKWSEGTGWETSRGPDYAGLKVRCSPDVTLEQGFILI